MIGTLQNRLKHHIALACYIYRYVNLKTSQNINELLQLNDLLILILNS